MGVEYERYLLPVKSFFRPSSEQLCQLVNALRAESWVPSATTRNLDHLRSPYAHLASPAFGVVQRRAHWETQQEFRVAGVSSMPDPLTSNWLDQNLDCRLRWSIIPDDAAEPEDGDDVDCDLLQTLYGLRYPLLPIEEEGGAPYYDLSIHWADDYVWPIDAESTVTASDSKCTCGAELEWTDNDFRQKIRAPFDTRIRVTCPTCSRPFDPMKGLSDGETGGFQTAMLHRFAVHVDCGKCYPLGQRPSFHPDLKARVEEILGCATVEVGKFR